MGNFTDAYEMTGKITDTGISFFFLSEGKKDVFKNIEYSYVLDHQGKKVFNLAFGDYSFKTGTLHVNFWRSAIGLAIGNAELLNAKKRIDVSIFTGITSTSTLTA